MTLRHINQSRRHHNHYGLFRSTVYLSLYLLTTPFLAVAVGSIRGSAKVGRDEIPPGVEVSIGGGIDELDILHEQKDRPHTDVEYEIKGSDQAASKPENIQSDTNNTNEYQDSDITDETEKEASSYYHESGYDYNNGYGGDGERRYGDYGVGGQGYGYDGGYGGGYPNYCPGNCRDSIRHSEKCKAWFSDCNRYLGWCGSRKGYGGYHNKLKKNHKSSSMMTTAPQDNEDVVTTTAEAKQDPFSTQSNETSVQAHNQTNVTKEASYGGIGFEYDRHGGGGGYEYCPHRCMKSILHAKKCKTYYPSCNRHFGWCGGIHYGGGYYDGYNVGGGYGNGHGYEYGNGDGYGYEYGYGGDYFDGYKNEHLPYQNYQRTRDVNNRDANVYKSTTHGDYRRNTPNSNGNGNGNGNANTYQTTTNGDGDTLLVYRAQKSAAKGDNVDNKDNHEA